MTGGSKSTRRQALGAITLAASVGVLDAAPLFAQAGQALRLRVINTAGTSAMVFQDLLETQGILRALGVEVVNQNAADGTKVIDTLLRGDADVCMQAGFGSVLIAIDKGAPLKVIAGGNMLNPQAVYSARPDIRELKDLVGHTVGVGAMGAAMHQKMVALLRKRGIDDTAVRFVNVGSTLDSLKATRAGTVDAGIADIDIYADQARYGVHALTDGNFWNGLTEYTNQAAFATEAAIATHRAAIVRVVAAYARLYRFLETPQSLQPWLATWARIAKVAVPARPDPLWTLYQEQRPFPPQIAISPERTDFLQKLNVSMGLQQRELPYDRVFDRSISADALKLLA